MRLLASGARLAAAGTAVAGLLFLGVGQVAASSNCPGTTVTPNACISSTPATAPGNVPADYEDASNGLSVSFDSATLLPITAGEANVVLDVADAGPGTTPAVFGVDANNSTFNGYTLAVPPGYPPGKAWCTVADANGNAKCYISVPSNAKLPVTFYVTDQVSLPTNQVPEVPYAAGLPLLLALALPLRRWLTKSRKGIAS